MPMISQDLIAQQRVKFSTAITQAVKDGDEDAMATAFADFAQNVQDYIISDAQALSQAQLQDTSVLAARGIRQLTSAEQKWYGDVINAMKGADPKQALTNISVAMPETVIDSVMDDMQQAHPLLNLINFVNTMGVIKMIVNKQGTQSAVWGGITAAITAELSGAFAEIDVGLYKLTAFIPVSKGLLDLGPAWLDQYVRAILSEANAATLESSVADGDGNGKPIGMTRSVADDVTVTGGVYPRKTAIAITDLSPTTYGSLLAKLSKTPIGGTRAIDKVILLANPTDYFTKVMPATTIRAADGTFVSNVFPFPTDAIQSAGVPSGFAVIGLPKRYFMGLGSPKDGKIEFDDSCQFLQDNRVYITKLYGNGRALDDDAFILLDISGLKPANQTIEIVNTAANPVKTKEVTA